MFFDVTIVILAAAFRPDNPINRWRGRTSSFRLMFAGPWQQSVQQRQLISAAELALASKAHGSHRQHIHRPEMPHPDPAAQDLGAMDGLQLELQERM